MVKIRSNIYLLRRRTAPPGLGASHPQAHRPGSIDQKARRMPTADRRPPGTRTARPHGAGSSFGPHFQLRIPDSATSRTGSRIPSERPARPSRPVHPSRIDRAKTERRRSRSSKTPRASPSGGRRGGTDRWGRRFRPPFCGRHRRTFTLSNG